MREFGQPGIAGLALDRDLESSATGAGDRGVGLPVADLTACEDVWRPLPDRDSLRNMGLAVPTRVAAILATPVRAHETRDKMPRLRIDPLVDGLMTDRRRGAAQLESPGDKLRRPTSLEAVGHIAADARVFKATVAPGQAVALRRTLLCLVGEVVTGVNRRSVPPKLP